MPKYVMSSTLVRPAWNNSTVLAGDLVEEVTGLNAKIGGDIVVPASSRIVRTLLEHDFVDQLRLKVFPVVLGAGERLFSELTEMKHLRLVDTRTLDGDTTYLIYDRAGARGS
jgi:dihydrofolate reductase